jgi:hypothetical protein
MSTEGREVGAFGTLTDVRPSLSQTIEDGRAYGRKKGKGRRGKQPPSVFRFQEEATTCLGGLLYPADNCFPPFHVLLHRQDYSN